MLWIHDHHSSNSGNVRTLSIIVVLFARTLITGNRSRYQIGSQCLASEILGRQSVPHTHPQAYLRFDPLCWTRSLGLWICLISACLDARQCSPSVWAAEDLEIQYKHGVESWQPDKYLSRGPSVSWKRVNVCEKYLIYLLNFVKRTTVHEIHRTTTARGASLDYLTSGNSCWPIYKINRHFRFPIDRWAGFS